MSDAPKSIWLQYFGMDADEMRAEYGDDWCEAHEITWCVDCQYDTDIEFIRADLDTYRGIANGAEAEIERLRTALRRAADEPNIDKARAIADEALERQG